MNLLFKGASMLTIEPKKGQRQQIAWRHPADKNRNYRVDPAAVLSCVLSICFVSEGCNRRP